MKRNVYRDRRRSRLSATVAAVLFMVRCLLSVVMLAVAALLLIAVMILWGAGIWGLGLAAYGVVVGAVAAATWLSWMCWPESAWPSMNLDQPQDARYEARLSVPAIGEPAPWDEGAAELERLFWSPERWPPHDLPPRAAAPQLPDYAGGPYGVADWQAPLTEFEQRAGVVAPVSPGGSRLYRGTLIGDNPGPDEPANFTLPAAADETALLERPPRHVDGAGHA